MLDLPGQVHFDRDDEAGVDDIGEVSSRSALVRPPGMAIYSLPTL